MIPIAETHRRYLELIAKHGSDQERQQVADTLKVMRQLTMEARDAGCEYEWQPMTEIVMPDFLVDRAIRVAHERIQLAEKHGARNKQGAVRDEDDEIRSVVAQYAACLILGIRFADVPRNIQAGRAHGNLGTNFSAFIPKPGSFQLLVLDKEPPGRRMILIHQVATKVYQCPGWYRAGDAQQPDFAKTNVRNDVDTRFYLVPAAMMRPLRELWP